MRIESILGKLLCTLSRKARQKATIEADAKRNAARPLDVIIPSFNHRAQADRDKETVEMHLRYT